MNEQPKDLIVSMRWPVALAFVVAWNGPLIYYLIHTRFDVPESIFWRLVLIQIAVLVVACLLVALFPALHRFVFRPEVPERYFRRRLLIGAGLYALMGLIVWAVPAIAV
jgi:hypothetical protein